MYEKPKIVVLFVDTSGEKDKEKCIEQRVEKLQKQLGDDYKVVGVDSKDKVKFPDSDDTNVNGDYWTYPFYPYQWDYPDTSPTYPTVTWIVTNGTVMGTKARKED